MTGTNCTFKEVDFYEEHQYIISLGLARQPRDVNIMRFYRITSIGTINPNHTLRLANAKLECKTWVNDGFCDEVIEITNSLLPSTKGVFLMHMRGSLDAPSKCLVSCPKCGSRYLITADATVGQGSEGYIVVFSEYQPKAPSSNIPPFISADRIDIVSGKIGSENQSRKKWWQFWK